MKLFTRFFALAIVVVFAGACQKELDYQVDGLSRGSLKSNASGDCLPSTINGIFKEDSLLNNNNFIDLQVNVTVTGTYTIVSDTINGYSFRANGNFDSTGLNNVRLQANGMPLAPGLNTFTITFDSSLCRIDVTVISSGTGPATYSLPGVGGVCTGALSNGSYVAGTALDINNTVSIQVDVTDTGFYSIQAPAVNGMVFSSSGLFTNTGVQTVILNGTGTPLTAGIFNLTAGSGSNNCTFSITVLPAGGGSVAVFTLDATGNACSGATSSGTYDAGVPLTATNTVIINVTVISAGIYTITSNTDNGISFNASGTFTSTGPQPVTLVGTGTPGGGGTFNFTAASGASVCTFSITVSGIPASSLDYVPESAFSNYTYRYIGGTPSDTFYLQVSPNSVVRNGITYKIFEEKELGVVVDSTFRRKDGGRYYEYFDDVNGFSSASNTTDALVLDSTLAVNGSWIIDLGTGVINSLPATGRVNCVITEKGATVTLAGITYTNVIKVSYTYQYDTGSGFVAYEAEEIWYGKGKGMLYFKVDNLGGIVDEFEVVRSVIF